MGERIVHILFVEYHAAFRQAASHLIDREADLEVVAQGGSVRQAREKLAQGA
jgi:DNA-binding NarL/FixJ family response regulator